MREVVLLILPMCIIGFINYVFLYEDDENTGCGCWIFMIWIAFQLYALYLAGADVYFYMKQGYWFNHGSMLEWLESDGNPAFVEWIGIRKLLSNIKYNPSILASILGHIAYGIILKCVKEDK